MPRRPASGNPVVYVGSKTGRDGIHGATMASSVFDADAEARRPTVQVGDPFTEKLLLEACLELMATDAIVAIQDMGAAGLTSSALEMAAKGGVGIALDLDLVPTREAGMNAYEIMLSESQERMLMVLRPDAEPAAERVFRKWGLDFAVIGRLTDTGRVTLTHEGGTAADIPVDPLVEAAPRYRRPYVVAPRRAMPSLGDPGIAPLDALERLIATPDLASRRWIWEQYDHMVMGDTAMRPGGDAAVIRIHGSARAIALTTDCTPRYCAADPREGGRQAVAEAWRNLVAAGARPLAVTDNLNFGDPERPEIMGQLVGCIEGIGEACRALDFPVVSGNVSLYNETDGRAILPTPVIGGLGLLDDVSRRTTIAFGAADREIVAIGATAGHLGQSLFLRDVLATPGGPPPPVDLEIERRNGLFVQEMIAGGRVSVCHDISDGGLLVAVAEMALASGIGAEIAPPQDADPLAWLFGEDQGRYLVAVPDAAPLLAAAAASGVPAAAIGRSAGAALTVSGRGRISLGRLREAHEAWLPRFMEGR